MIDRRMADAILALGDRDGQCHDPPRSLKQAPTEDRSNSIGNTSRATALDRRETYKRRPRTRRWPARVARPPLGGRARSPEQLRRAAGGVCPAQTAWGKEIGLG